MKNIAIVTGASGGLGKEFIRIIADRVDEVWAVARNRARLDELFIEYGRKLLPFCLDLSVEESIAGIETQLEKGEYNIKYLVNNAGYGKFGEEKNIPLKDSLGMIDVNVRAVVGLTKVCLKNMSAGSRIINIASVASFMPLPYMSEYAATKAFVRSYTRALNVEIKSLGMSATAVCPGWMDTDFIPNGDTETEVKVTRFKHKTSPARVAEKALKDADKGRDMSTLGAFNKLTHAAAKVLPQKRMMKMWLKQQKIKTKKYKPEKG